MVLLNNKASYRSSKGLLIFSWRILPTSQEFSRLLHVLLKPKIERGGSNPHLFPQVSLNASGEVSALYPTLKLIVLVFIYSFVRHPKEFGVKSIEKGKP